MKARVAVFSELPTPYRWPVYERLLRRSDLDLRIFFCARGEPDRDWDFDFRPDARVRFLPGSTVTFAGRRTVHYHLNPGVFGVLRRGAFDVAVFPGWAMFVSHAGALWCRATRRKYVLFAETHGLTARPPVVRFLRRILLRPIVGGASAWLAAGQAATEHFVRHGARRERIFLFPNSADVHALAEAAARAAPTREARRAELGAAKRRVVLSVSRLIHAKRIDLVLRAVAELGDEAPAVWVAGTGPERRRLASLADSLGLSGVRFLGPVPHADLPALYASADLLVLASDHEPWGAVVGEAMACELPVVVSDAVGAGPDLVLPGVTGLTFPHGDVRALAEAIRRLLSGEEARRTMGRAAAFEAGRFDHEFCAESFAAAIRAALSR